jgi:hypothetical protein
MNIGHLLITAGEDVLAKVKALLAEGEHAVETTVVPIVVTDAQAAVAKLKQLPIATTAANLISGLMTQPQAGETKLQQVVGYIKPLVTESEDIVREFVQSVYNDVTGALANSLNVSKAA